MNPRERKKKRHMHEMIGNMVHSRNVHETRAWQGQRYGSDYFYGRKNERAIRANL